MKYYVAIAVLIIAIGAAVLRLQQSPSGADRKPPPPAPVQPPPAPIIDPVQEERVINATKDNNPSVRWNAVLFLINMRSTKAKPIIFWMLHHDMDSELKVKLIGLLAKNAGPDAPEVIRQIESAAHDPNSKVRIEAMKTLDQMSDFAASPLLTRALRDQDADVRRQALLSLNDLQSKWNAKVLADMKAQMAQEAQAACRARLANEPLWKKLARSLGFTEDQNGNGNCGN
jgi:HEAT repeat protein